MVTVIYRYIRWWSTKMFIQYWESFLMPHQGAGAISASGNGSDVIQDGGRKRKLLLDGASKSLLILLKYIPTIVLINGSEIKHYINSAVNIILTHWGRVAHICVGNLAIIGSDNDLSPGRRQAIIWTNAGILLILTLRTNFSDFFREIRAFSFKKIYLKMSSWKWRPSCLGLNVLISS